MNDHRAIYCGQNPAYGKLFLLFLPPLHVLFRFLKTKFNKWKKQFFYAKEKSFWEQSFIYESILVSYR